MTQHSKWFSPSGSSGWLRCAAFESSSGSNPNSRLGTAAHEFAEFWLEHWKKTGNDLEFIKVKDMEIVVEDDVFTVDREMFDYIQEYVFEIQAACGFDSELLQVEERVNFGKVIGVGDEKGTADAIILNPTPNVALEVHDLKYGTGVKVNATNNSQGMFYAIGALNGELYKLDDEVQVKIAIHQPRLNHYDEWVVTIGFIKNWIIENRLALEERIAVSMGADPTAHENPGEIQCQWCAKKATCKALESQVLEAFEDESQELDKLVVNYEKVAMIRDWCKAIEGKAYSLCEQGEFPGYKMVAGRKGNAKWHDKATEQDIEEMGENLNVDPYVKKLKTPTQFKKGLAKKHMPVVDLMVVRPEGKLMMVPESDKRPAISLADDFDDVSE